MKKIATQIFTLIAGLAIAAPSVYAQEDCAANGGTISTESPTMFVTNDGEPDIVEVTREGMNEDLFLAWVITSDEADPAIIDIFTSLDISSFDFEGFEAGSYNLWSMSVDVEASNINDALAGFPVSTVYFSDFSGCWAVSNAVTITATHENSEPDEEGCFASEIINFSQGTQMNGNPVAANRSNPEMALGEPDASNAVGGFVSLGVGGSITLGFDGNVMDGPGNDLRIFETSFSGDICGNSDDEFADIELSQDGIEFIYVATICRDAEIDIADSGLEYITQIRISSAEMTSTPDGYDVDGVEAIHGCASMPVEEDGCYGGEVLAYNPGPDDMGNPLTNPLRIDPTKALGAPQIDETFNFVSLGFEGEIILGFDGGAALNGPGMDLLVVETTFGGLDFDSYPESADIYVSQNGVDFFYVGMATTNGLAMFDISDAGQGFEFITAVKIVDTTPLGETDSFDGYDVDGIEALNGCGPIPDIVPGDCYATEVVSYIEGTTFNGGSIDFDRTDPTQALGEPERIDELVFVSLGYGGELVLSFDGSIPNLEGDDIEIVETTYNHTTCATYPEFADVYVSENGINFHFAKTICRDDNFVDISDAGAFTYINFVKIVNNNELSTSPDAFDVDGVVAIHNCEEGELDGFAQTDALNTVVSVYPNPSAGQVVIEFTPAVSERAMVEIYDMNGRVVETIYNQEVQAGQNYRLDFNGTHLPNGIYIAKFSTDTETAIEKIMIAK